MLTFHCPKCRTDLTGALAGSEPVTLCPRCGAKINANDAQHDSRVQGTVIGALLFGAVTGGFGQHLFFKKHPDPTPGVVIGASTAVAFAIGALLWYRFAGKPAGNFGCVLMLLIILAAVVLAALSAFL